MPAMMIRRAIDGYYSDYGSPLAMPELQLRNDLLSLARHPATPYASRQLLKELAQRVVEGEFDGTKEESDEWARSSGGLETFRELTAGMQPEAAKRFVREVFGVELEL